MSRRPAGRTWLLVCLTSVLLVLALAGPAAALPGRFFGVHWTTDDERDGSKMRFVAQTGAQYFLIPIEQLPVKPGADRSTPGDQRYDWSRDDALFDKARKHGVTILPELGPAGDPTRDLGAWTDFVRAAVERYGAGGSFWNGHDAFAPPAWEVLNEPNNYGPEPTPYTNLLRSTAAAVHAAHGKVLFAGVYWYRLSGHLSGSEFLRQALALHAGRYVDGFALHPYALLNPKKTNRYVQTVTHRVMSAIREARDLLDGYADARGKGIWITELGWPVLRDYGDAPPTGADQDVNANRVQHSVSPRLQAELLTAVFHAAARAADTYNLKSLLWYSTHDTKSYSWAYYAGLQDRNGCYRPSYRALMGETGTRLRQTQLSSAAFGIRNGTPGAVSVKGELSNGTASDCLAVRVAFEKWGEGAWHHKFAVEAKLTGNDYLVSNRPVGVGSWRVRAIFSGEGPFAGSESAYHRFEITAQSSGPQQLSGPGAGAGAPAPAAPALTPTQAFLTVSQTLNGQPGYASVYGHVTAGSAPLNGVYVNVNFQKQQPDGSWQTMSSAHPVVVDGAYQVDYWGVGVGQWRVRVVLPQQGLLAPSESDYHFFQIKSGYRLVNRRSGRCMSVSQNSAANGAAIIQWACSPSPSPGDGQVLTLVPMGGGFFELKINSTGKCVDVLGVSLADGARLDQWDCLGAGQANQLWQVIPIAGQDGWFAFGVKHSGKCADVLGARTDDGAPIGQWACTWAGNQQWRFEAIG